LMKAAGDLAGSLGELVADGAIGDGHAVINKGRGRSRLLAGLEAHIFQERGLGKVTFANVAGVMNTLPPANKVQQVVGVGAQGGVRQVADIFAIQVTLTEISFSARVKSACSESVSTSSIGLMTRKRSASMSESRRPSAHFRGRSTIHRFPF